MLLLCHQHAILLLSFLTLGLSFQKSHWVFRRSYQSISDINHVAQTNKVLVTRAESESNSGNAQSTVNVLKENIYREYPYDNISIPILPDCNNYYSGQFKDYFWHQNSDQVLVYIPIPENIKKNDVKVNFGALKVSVKIDGMDDISFDCIERLIPDGSFWCIEKDNTGQRYIQLDLEKRFRMINWKALFQASSEDQVDEAVRRSEMLTKLMKANKSKNVGSSLMDDLESRVTSTIENKILDEKIPEDWQPSKDEIDSIVSKLLAANQGMSKITGVPAETLEDMDEEAIRKITAEVDEEPTIISDEFVDAEFGDSEPPSSS